MMVEPAFWERAWAQRNPAFDGGSSYASEPRGSIADAFAATPSIPAQRRIRAERRRSRSGGLSTLLAMPPRGGTVPSSLQRNADHGVRLIAEEGRNASGALENLLVTSKRLFSTASTQS
jgi:hypothetical protein